MILYPWEGNFKPGFKIRRIQQEVYGISVRMTEPQLCELQVTFALVPYPQVDLFNNYV